MITKHFDNWDYYAVKELEEICRLTPTLSSDRAIAFFKQASRATKSNAEVVERQFGNLFEGMMGFVRASDRKDFSASCEDGSLETFGYGIMVVETYDEGIGVTFCLARISENAFLTYGWIGEKNRQSVKALLSKPYTTIQRKWWKIWQ